jgi:DNA-binding transcriptional ArsR family regulator
MATKKTAARKAPDPAADGVSKGPGRFAWDGLDRVLHEKARLSILSSLFSNSEGLLFGDLKELCSLTDGNLSRHLQILSEAGLLEIWKGFQGRRPQTLCRLSAAGRERFLDYIEELEKVVRAVAEAPARRGKKSSGAGVVPPGWVMA